ncbi:MAG TPA: histidine kinase, partial [Longimicrobium sp.]|nr:histidine kinase [Longimicrobium sp.]
ARRWPLHGAGWRRRVAPNLAAWVALVVLHTLLQFLFDRFMRGSKQPYWMVLVFFAPGFLIIHMNVIATAHAAYFHRRWRERAAAEAAAQARLARKRLEILRSRLRPDLVYRALERVSELAGSDTRAADRLVASLGDLLRRALKPDVDGTGPLGRELGFLEEWIAVENAVREHPVRLEIDADFRVVGVAVPPLLLQPVVEVLIHEHRSTPRPLNVRIVARPGPGGTGVRVRTELPPRPEGGGALRTDGELAASLRRHYGSAVDVQVRETPEALRISLTLSPLP